ncbi:MAG: macrocin-O-methyltransferase [Rhodospirillaceae bacterium]|nr:macrocin-O-methyltransferase [Magnetovibrio sp.]MAY67254.1 macrocin-O-methyltransferase [Rhodospirillaceae bacterium]
MPEFDDNLGGSFYEGDQRVISKLQQFTEKWGIDGLKALEFFPLLTRRTWLNRMLAHYNLFMHTIDLPGDIIEFGVFRGNSLFSWANFLEIHTPGDRTKQVFGFDTWQGIISLDEKDGDADPNFGKQVGAFQIENLFEFINDAKDIFDADRFVPWKDRIVLVQGPIEETFPKFIEENPGRRFSLCHFDCDLYEPTKVGLDLIYDKIVPGGVIIFDEYGNAGWQGETLAVDEFVSASGAQLRKLEWAGTPRAYVVKE